MRRAKGSGLGKCCFQILAVLVLMVAISGECVGQNRPTRDQSLKLVEFKTFHNLGADESRAAYSADGSLLGITKMKMMESQRPLNL